MIDFMRWIGSLIIVMLLAWLGFSISPSETPPPSEDEQNQSILAG